jgi:membrane protein DedA with SNARE-associated domain
MKKAWFVRSRRFYKPISLYGWVLTFAAVVYIGFSVIRIVNQSLKLNETLSDILLQVIITAVVYATIAYFTQKRETK